MIGMFLQSAGTVSRGTGANVSGIDVLLPILVFLIVFVVLAAILQKIKILGGNIWIDLIVSLFIAIIFVTVTSVREFLLGVIPWFAVLLVGLFFVLVLMSFVSGGAVPIRFLVWLFFILLLVVFLGVGLNVFGGGAGAYLPGPFFGVGATNFSLLVFFNWLYSPKILGTFWFIVATVIVTWILIKSAD